MQESAFIHGDEQNRQLETRENTHAIDQRHGSGGDWQRRGPQDWPADRARHHHCGLARESACCRPGGRVDLEVAPAVVGPVLPPVHLVLEGKVHAERVCIGHANRGREAIGRAIHRRHKGALGCAARGPVVERVSGYSA